MLHVNEKSFILLIWLNTFYLLYFKKWSDLQMIKKEFFVFSQWLINYNTRFFVESPEFHSVKRKYRALKLISGLICMFWRWASLNCSVHTPILTPVKSSMVDKCRNYDFTFSPLSWKSQQYFPAVSLISTQ